MMSFKASALLALPFLSTLASAATYFPLLNQTDTDGTGIQAHGGNIIQAQDGDGSYYWFGEDKTGWTNTGSFIGVSCYKSSDLNTWTNQGHVLSPIADTNISESRIVERPKVLYNDKNSEYVMWFHGDSSNYGDAQVGVATSKTIDGQYEWKGNFKPFGNDSRDMTIWKDPDNAQAYLIFATSGNADFQIATLDDDYYNVVEAIYTFDQVFQEAPGVFKIDGKFYLLFSPQDGWTPTDNGYHVADSMSGPWSDATLLHPKGAYAYLTQNAYDITIKGSEQTFYLYLGDHWNANNLGASSYAFYPVLYDGSGLVLHPTGGWTLDVEKGTWSDLPFTTITADNSTTPDDQLIKCEDSCAGGLTANMTSTENSFTFTWDGSEGDKVVQILYTYPGAKNAFRHITATVDGAAVEGWALLETTRAQTFAQRAPLPLSLKSGSEVVLKMAESGLEVRVDAVEVYDAA
ncbi:putative glycoside hydrolase, family 43 [Septoria linicola]|nr:putative glycoside hydrolase, family 43 [Septoria linicola]